MNNNSRSRLLLAAWPQLEAVFRTRSFTAAGQELGMTQSAVSHRIRTLEQALGLSLFRRTTRSVEATEEGLALHDAVRAAIASVNRALGGLEARRRQGPLRLSAPSSLVAKWLIPRLEKMQAAWIHSEVSLIADDRIADLSVNEADIAIRFSPQPTPGLHCTRLVREAMTPVASVANCAAARSTASPAERLADWSSLSLLADSAGETDSTGLSWRAWASAVGLADEPLPIKQTFNRSDLALQAAISGLGVALGRTLLIEQDLMNGFLAPCHEAAVDMKSSYWFVCLPERADDPAVSALRNWLRKEMTASKAAVMLSVKPTDSPPTP